MKKAIDVSAYQGVIDWDAVKRDGVAFAAIRGGLGDDLYSQDDAQFERNWTECQRVGIPCTMYFFSYAAAKDGDITSELAHIRRLMRGKTMNSTAPIYIDVENTKGLDWRALSDAKMLEIMKRYKEGLEKLGFKMGIYSSRSAFWNEKMTDPWYAENVSIWVAEYANQVNNFSRPYDLWQYSSSGSVNGIKGRVDMDWLYADFSIHASTVKGDANGDGEVDMKDLVRLKNYLANVDDATGKSTVEISPGADANGDGVVDNKDIVRLKKELANASDDVELTVNTSYQVYAKGRWLPNVTNREDYAGVFGQPVSGVYASASNCDLIYKVGLLGGKWLPEVKNREDYAGILGKAIDRIMVRSTAGNTVHVQAHANGRWLPPVTGYNEKDANNGYAGIKGQAIDAIYIWADPIK